MSNLFRVNPKAWLTSQQVATYLLVAIYLFVGMAVLLPNVTHAALDTTAFDAAAKTIADAARAIGAIGVGLALTVGIAAYVFSGFGDAIKRWAFAVVGGGVFGALLFVFATPLSTFFSGLVTSGSGS